MIAVVFLTAFIWIELTMKKPLVDLRLLRNRNFGIGTVANMLVGFALFGTVYVLPQYLGQVQGYNAEQIGNVLAWTGLPQLLIIPFVPFLMKRFDVRYVGFFGIALFSLSCFMNIDDVARLLRRSVLRAEHRARDRSGSRPDAAHGDRHRRHRAEGCGERLRPLQHAAQSRRRVGTASLETIITKREQFHSNIIGQSVTVYRDDVRQRIAEMTDYFMAHGVVGPRRAQHKAIVALGKIVKRQALIMALQRYLRRHRRDAGHRRRRVALRPQRHAGRRRGWSSLSRQIAHAESTCERLLADLRGPARDLLFAHFARSDQRAETTRR